MKKTTRKSPAKSAPTPKKVSPLPYQLRILGLMLGGTQAQTRQALQVARKSVEQYIDLHDVGERSDVAGSFDYYVQQYAANDNPKSVKKALDAIGGEGNCADLILAYSYPAYLAGMAFTWLMLRGDYAEGGAK